MANEKILQSKQAIVAELAEKLKGAASGILVDYKGVTVAEDTQLRNELRAANVEYSVVKNTLLRFASKEAGYEEFDPLLNGTTSIAMSMDDSIAPVRTLNEFAKKMNGKFEIKGGFVDGKILPLEELKAIAEIPSKAALYGNLLGMMLAPITGLAVVLGQIAEKQGGAPAAAEAAE